MRELWKKKYIQKRTLRKAKQNQNSNMNFNVKLCEKIATILLLYEIEFDYWLSEMYSKIRLNITNIYLMAQSYDPITMSFYIMRNTTEKNFFVK